MATRFLITGVNGCSGRHLATRLRREPEAIVMGTGRQPCSIAAVDAYRSCDLTEREGAANLVAWAQPDVVLHLAGLNGMAPSREIARVNVAAFENLREALRGSTGRRRVRMLVVGSAAELGTVGTARLPADEQAACSPESAYGVSKHEIVGRALAEPRDGPLEMVVARPFNLVGPGLDPRLALGSFAAQLAAIVRGEADAIRSGSLDTRRDYLDVRDAVEAYAALARLGVPGELYNVCSGRSYEIGDLLGQLIDLAGVRAKVDVFPTTKPTGPKDIYGDFSKLARLSGWQPTIPIRDSLRDLWSAAREALSPHAGRAA